MSHELNMNMGWGMMLVLSFLLAPLMLGIINRVKAFFAGRQGPPLLQLYFDLIKLMQKGTVYSTSTSSIFRIAPVISLAVFVIAAMMLPFAGFKVPDFLVFRGDLILFVYLLALARIITVLAALDTASSFEGMGASREVQFSAIAEGAFMGSMTCLAVLGESLRLSDILTNHAAMNLITPHCTSIFLIALSLFLVMLSESCRVPFDDPNTHLELTMIHEAMILDNSGPDLAYILYGASLKLWIFASLIVMILIPFHGSFWWNIPVFLSAMALIGVLIGIVESVMARFRFIKIPQLLVGALGLTILGIVLNLVINAEGL